MIFNFFRYNHSTQFYLEKTAISVFLGVCLFISNQVKGFHCNFCSVSVILINAVLGGEVAVPYNSQSALARLNSFIEAVRMFGLPYARSVDDWVLRNGCP